MSEEKKTIKISEVLTDLENGLDRPAIKAKYDLSHAGMRSLFSHPKLKAKKTKKALDFVIEDDVPEQLKRKSTDATNRRKKNNGEAAVVDDTQAEATSVASTAQQTVAPIAQAAEETATQTQPATSAPETTQDQEPAKPEENTGTTTSGLW